MTENEMVGWHHSSMDRNQSELPEMVMDREAQHVAVHGITESDMTERLNNSNNTEFKYILKQYVVKCSFIIRNHDVESIIWMMWWYTITLKDLHILDSDYME